MDELNYSEARELTIEGYNELIEEDGFSPEHAISAAFEDSIYMMKKSSKVYVSVMLTLSILSLEQKFIPDYLLERIDKLEVVEELNDEEKVIYEDERAKLDKMLETMDYRINKNESYIERARMLINLTSVKNNS